MKMETLTTEDTERDQKPKAELGSAPNNVEVAYSYQQENN
jgi:hypothetical protein